MPSTFDDAPDALASSASAASSSGKSTSLDRCILLHAAKSISCPGAAAGPVPRIADGPSCASASRGTLGRARLVAELSSSIRCRGVRWMSADATTRPPGSPLVHPSAAPDSSGSPAAAGARARAVTSNRVTLTRSPERRGRGLGYCSKSGELSAPRYRLRRSMLVLVGYARLVSVSPARDGAATSGAFFVELAPVSGDRPGHALDDIRGHDRGAQERQRAPQARRSSSADGGHRFPDRAHNRRFFEEIIARELNLHRRYETPLSLVFLDIDRFKASTTPRSRRRGPLPARGGGFRARHVRNADYVFRWGGDEFLVPVSCRDGGAQAKAGR